MKRSTIASPDGALAFFFAIFALLIWYVSVFPSIDNLTLFSLSMVWLLLSAGTLIASLINMVRGFSRGNTNLLATILLGFIPGVDTLVALGMRVIGAPYHPVLYGVMYMIGAILTISAAWRRRMQPGYIFLRTLIVGLGLLCLGIGDTFELHGVLVLGGWLMFVFAMLSFYYGLSRLYEEFGFPLPEGKSFFKESEKTAGLPSYPKSKADKMSKEPLHPRQERLSSPDMIVAFICATFGSLSFAIPFFGLGDDSVMSAGIIRIVLGIIFYCSALINMFKGSPYGSLNLIFAVCFGLFAGSTLSLQSLHDVISFSIQPTFFGVVQLFAGLYLVAIIPATRKAPAYRSLAMFCSGMGFVTGGIDLLTKIPYMNKASGLFFLVFCLLNIYAGMSALLPSLHQGPTIDQLIRKEKA